MRRLHPLVKAALVLAGCGALLATLLYGFRALPRRTPAGQPPLADLRGRTDALRDAFERARGSVRLVVWLSPT